MIYLDTSFIAPLYIQEATSEAIREDADQSFSLIAVTTADFQLARELILQWETGLRAGDALHLEIAQNAHVDKFLSLDRRLIHAAQQFGIPADSGGLT